MPTRLLLLLCLAGHVFAKEPPDVKCVVVHLNYVHCYWNERGTPEVNYTFYGWFDGKTESECPNYLSENNTNTGCNQPYGDTLNRFSTFYTKLVHGEDIYQREHNLKDKVKLNPPTNVTVRYESDSNLWLSWSQIAYKCVESEVRHRINNRKWTTSQISIGTQTSCINLPSNNSLYEVQVRSRMAYSCGESEFWSDWSEPVYWGSNNGTDTTQMNNSMSVWTPVLYVVGALILILLVMMLLHHERIRIIFVPVPKPSPKLHNTEDWFQFPKVLKDTFNYNERPCPVREYCHVPQSDSESSDCSSCSVTTDQTDCSIFIPVGQSGPPTTCSSSASTIPDSSEEKQVSV